MLALLQFTVVLDFMIISPLGDILLKDMNISTGEFGTVVSAYAFSAGISGFLSAGIADRFDRKHLLLFFYCGFILGTLFCGLANTYPVLLAARIITGIFGGVIGSISMAIITDIFQISQRGRVMGMVQMAFAGSQILGIPAGLFLAGKYNWHATFFMIVILAMLILILIIMRMQPIRAHLDMQRNHSALQHLLQTIGKRKYRVGFLATSMLSMGGFMLMPFTSPFLVNNVGVLQAELPTVFMFTGVASMIIMPLVGRLSDRVDKFVLFTVGSVLASVMIVIYTNMSPHPLWLVILVNVVLFMGIMSRMVPAVALNSALPEAADRGAYMSINSSLQQFAGGMAALFAGLVVHQESKHSPIEHFDILGYIMVGIVFLCIFLIRRVDKLVHPSKKGW